LLGPSAERALDRLYARPVPTRSRHCDRITGGQTAGVTLRHSGADLLNAGACHDEACDPDSGDLGAPYSLNNSMLDVFITSIFGVVLA
jgi:hypothetical protein